MQAVSDGTLIVFASSIAINVILVSLVFVQHFEGKVKK